MTQSFPLDVGALSKVLNYLNLGIYITDRDRRIVLWNRKAEEITGHRATDVVGKACHDGVLEHTDKDGHQLCMTDLCPLHRSMSLDRESDQAILVYAKKADGRRAAGSTSTAPLHDDAGRVIGGIETFRDETDRVSNLEFARKIQEHLMPKAMPQTGTIRFDVRYYPHDLIGGDFFDIRHLEPGRYGVLVADVSGHGVSAALYTMWLKSMGDTFADVAADPARFLGSISRELGRLSLDESFATAVYAVVGAESCEITYTNAGHPAPLHFRADGEVGQLKATGLPLGISDDAGYGVETIRFEPGDLLLCYTDGVTEVTDDRGEPLGEAGLIELVQDELSRPKGNLLESVHQRVERRCTEVALPDDVLLLSVRNQSRPDGD